MFNALDGVDYFPPEFIDPSLKEDNAYGLQYAKAMYNCGTRYGPQFYTGLTDYDYLIELAQGRESVEGLRKLFGYYRNADDRFGPPDPTKDLAYIDPKILSLAPKYINRVVAKMQRFSYDVGVEAIDVVSIDEKADYAAVMQAYYRMRKWAKDMNFNPQVLFPEIDVSTLPEYPDEMVYDISVNPKIKKEISGELFIQLVHAINNFQQKMREVDWDLAVIGRGHLHCYADQNGVPRVDRVNDKFWIGSYVDNDDFEQQEYAGFFDFITVNQFIKETADEMTIDEQLEKVQAYVNKNAQGSFIDYKRLENYDGLGYIPVLRFYFRSTDDRRYVQKKSQFGRPILIEKSHNYRPPKELTEKLENGEMRVISNSYTSIYGGTWIVDSDCVYNYKRQPYPRENLVNATLPIKTFAVNHKEGRVVSFLAQMIEPLNMANVAWNKIKQILAEGRMGVMEIDFNQIEDIAMGTGGLKWTPKDVITFLFRKNILIKRGKTNQYEQKINDALVMNSGGVQLADYFNAFQTAIQTLESLTATSAIEQTTVPDRLAVKNAEMSQMTADIDMEYMFNAHEYLYLRTSHQLMIIGQGSLQEGKKISGFIPALGKVNMGYFVAPKNIAYCEFGMFLTRQPSPEEWANFYLDLSETLKQGRISASDSAFVREINNLKQARHILAIREQIFQRKQQELMQQQAQMQMEANAMSAQQALESKMAELQEQSRLKKEELILQGEIQAKLQEQKNLYDRNLKSVEHQVKQSVAKQVSTDEIIKQGLRNIPEKGRNAVDIARMDIDREKLAVEREKIAVEEKKVQVMKSKPKTSSK